jgi:hypothetical protein
MFIMEVLVETLCGQNASARTWAAIKNDRLSHARLFHKLNTLKTVNKFFLTLP